MSTEEYQQNIGASGKLRYRAIPSRSSAACGDWEVVLSYKLYESRCLTRYVTGEYKAKLYAWWLNLTRNPNLGGA